MREVWSKLIIRIKARLWSAGSAGQNFTIITRWLQEVVVHPPKVPVHLADFDNMLNFIKGLVKGRCQFCDNVVDGEAVKERVKIPGYTGRHKRTFCSQDHLQEWRSFVEDWEEENHKIPKTNKGSTCVNCMR